MNSTLLLDDSSPTVLSPMDSLETSGFDLETAVDGPFALDMRRAFSRAELVPRTAGPAPRCGETIRQALTCA